MTPVPTSEDLPRGRADQQDSVHPTGAALSPESAAPVVVLVSADWAGPSRPAPTVLRELGRRWGDDVTVLLVEDPSDDLLLAWDVEVLPTWLRFVPAATGAAQEAEDAAGAAAPGGPESGGAAAAAGAVSGLILPELAGEALDGRAVVLPGPWRLMHRRTGAQPKHVIAAEFGPSS